MYIRCRYTYIIITMCIIVMSRLLTTVLSTGKAYSRNGFNQMWILKTSNDFSNLCTTTLHSKLKSRLKDLVTNSFLSKSGKRRYSYIVVHGFNTYFVKDRTTCKTKYTEDDIVNMINFLIDNIFIEFGGRIFQQIVSMPMGINCAPLLVDLFLYTHEAEFVQELLRKGEKKSARYIEHNKIHIIY